MMQIFSQKPSLDNSLSPLSVSQSSGAGKVFDDFERMKRLSIMESTSSEKRLFPITHLEHKPIEEKLFDNLAHLKIMTAEYAIAYIDDSFRKQLFNQLDWILDPQEWEDGYALAKPESFKTLIKFILNAKPCQAPHLGLSDDGNLVASWRHGANKLMLECLSHERTKWFISLVFENEKERVSGESTSLKRLLEALSPYKKVGWFISE